jgi:hypothetical protein
MLAYSENYVKLLRIALSSPLLHNKLHVDFYGHKLLSLSSPETGTKIDMTDTATIH